MKIIVVGNSSVGKTSLLNRFINNTFDLNAKATIGIESKFKTLEMKG